MMLPVHVLEYEKPCTMLCNKGSKFVGAANKIKQLIDSWSKQDLADHLKRKKEKWTVNPPPWSSPIRGIMGEASQRL